MGSLEAKTNIAKNWLGPFDSTLREGEQFAGPLVINERGKFELKPHEFTLDEAQVIVGLLHQIGIQKAEVGNPLAQGMDERIRQLLQMPNRPQLFSHIRNETRDANAAFSLKPSGLDGIHILTTVDQRRLKNMGHTMETYLAQLKNIVLEAKRLGMETRVGVEHAWNISFDQALPVYLLAQDLGVDRISIADTVGIATHWDVAEKIRELRKSVPSIPIEGHFHNDFLSAVANSIEALANGANYIDTTLAAGAGERTGITPLSVLLARLYKINPNLVAPYQTQMLTMADNTVAGMMGIALPHNSITAATAFYHRSGLHINGVMNVGPELYEPLDPSIIGNNRRIVSGTNISGRTSRAQANHFLHSQLAAK